MIDYTFRFTCDRCSRVEQPRPIRWNRYEEMMRPSKPDGWRWVGGALICADHRIDVKIDGTNEPRADWWFA